jgi:hypothetical protein
MDMTFYGWNKTGNRRFEVFHVTKENSDTRSQIGATVAVFKTQRECEADCMARNQVIAQARAE